MHLKITKVKEGLRAAASYLREERGEKNIC
jgi:hypothetical protein